MQLLLLSNSTMPGEPFFQWPRPYVQAFLQGKKRIGFVPFAAPEEQQQAYVEKVTAVLAEIGLEIVSLHTEKDPAKTLADLDAIAVGGGNTFLLLRDPGISKEGNALPGLERREQCGVPHHNDDQRYADRRAAEHARDAPGRFPDQRSLY